MIIPMRSFFRKDLILFSIHTQLLGLILCTPVYKIVQNRYIVERYRVCNGIERSKSRIFYNAVQYQNLDY